MALKTHLTTEEKYGLTDEQIYTAEKHLKKYQTHSTLSREEAQPLYEMRLLGYSYIDINIRHPNIPLGKIILTASFNHWEKDAESIAGSIFDRIKSTMVRSTVEQVEMLTGLISVFNMETQEEVRKYLIDPKNNPPPTNRIQNFKELQRTIEMLGEVTNAIKNLAVPAETKKPKATVVTQKKIPKGETEEAVMLAELVGDNGNG